MLGQRYVQFYASAVKHLVQVLLCIGHHACHVHLFARHEVGSLLGFCNERHIAYEVAQSHYLRLRLFKEVVLAFIRKTVAVEYGFDVAPDAAHRRAQLVRDIVAHLLFEFAALFSASHVSQRQFKTPVAINEHLHGKCVAAPLGVELEHGRLVGRGRLSAVEL